MMGEPEQPALAAPIAKSMTLFQRLASAASWFCIGILTIWASAALYFDFPLHGFHIPAVCVYLLAVGVLIARIKRHWLRKVAALSCFMAVLGWWLSLQPTNTADWQPNLDRTAWAELNGHRLTVHNFRDCSYQTETDYTCQWQTRSFRLSQVRGADLFFTHWGSPWIAHPIVSFQIGDSDHMAISIEARYKIGQGYSPIRSFFRQYELVFVVADERDLIRLRTNIHKTENVSLYHFTADSDHARTALLNYVERINQLHQRPEWYNAVTNNCTTNVYSQAAALDKLVGEWPGPIQTFPLNGRDDRKAYERGAFAGGLPFAELQRLSLINPAARAAGQSADFSRIIREGRPGFDTVSSRKAPIVPRASSRLER